MITSTYTLTEYKLRYPGEALVSMLRDRRKAYKRLAATGGDLTYVRTGRHQLFLINHPDLVREFLIDKADAFIKGRVLQRARFLFGEGLLTSEGSRHDKHKRLVAQSFRGGHMKSYAQTMADFATRFANTLQDGQTLRMDKEMTRLTLRIVGKTLFGANVQDEANEVSQALQTALHLFSYATNPFLDAARQILSIGRSSLQRSRSNLDSIIYKIIDQRRKTPQEENDLLSALLLAEEEETGDKLNNMDVRDHVLSLFLNGHDTTAVALSWAWYTLAQFPEVADKIHQEVETICCQDPVTAEHLSDLVYTRQVFREVIRLYPPVWVFGRQAIEDVTLGGFTVPEGAHVLVSPFFLHRNPNYWEHPERFMPERFEAGGNNEQHRFAYLPFSVGTRVCLGEHFAISEAVLVLAAISQKWRFSLNDPGPIDASAGLVLRPRRPMFMTVNRR